MFGDEGGDLTFAPSGNGISPLLHDRDRRDGELHRRRHVARTAPRAGLGRLLVLWLLASTLAAFDLWVNVFVPTPDWAFHQRSSLWAFGCVVLLLAVIPLTRLPSPTVTIGAGFLAGGVLGNLISGASDHLAVPNPLLLHTSADGASRSTSPTRSSSPAT